MQAAVTQWLYPLTDGIMDSFVEHFFKRKKFLKEERKEKEKHYKTIE